MKRQTSKKLGLSHHTVARLQGPNLLDKPALQQVAGGSLSYGGYCYGGDWHSYMCGSGGSNGCGSGDY